MLKMLQSAGMRDRQKKYSLWIQIRESRDAANADLTLKNTHIGLGSLNDNGYNNIHFLKMFQQPIV